MKTTSKLATPVYIEFKNNLEKIKFDSIIK